VFNLFAGFERLPPPCAELFAAEQDFSMSREWFCNMIANGLPPDTEACFGVLMDGATAIAIVPLQRSAAGALSGLSNCYTCVYRPLIAAHATEHESSYVLGRALGISCAGLPLIRIDCLPSEWPALAAFSAGVRSAGLVVRQFDCFGNWYEPMQGRSWEGYVDSRPGNLRELLRRRRRRAHRAGDVSYEIIEQGHRLECGIEAYEFVYQRSWKPAEPFPQFNAGLIQEAARLGVLRLGICWHNQTPIAAQLWIVAHGAATVMKLAHNEALRSLSPGTLLTATVIERLLEEGISEIDFGRGDDPYKQLWAGHRRQRIGLLLVNPRRLGGLYLLARHDMGRAIRGLRRRATVEGQPSRGGDAHTL